MRSTWRIRKARCHPESRTHRPSMLLMQSRRHPEAWVVRPEPPISNSCSEQERSRTMTFAIPEIVELGLAEELIEDEFGEPNTEDTTPARVKMFSPAYVADAE